MAGRVDPHAHHALGARVDEALLRRHPRRVGHAGLAVAAAPAALGRRRRREWRQIGQGVVQGAREGEVEAAVELLGVKAVAGEVAAEQRPRRALAQAAARRTTTAVP